MILLVNQKQEIHTTWEHDIRTRTYSNGHLIGSRDAQLSSKVHVEHEKAIVKKRDKTL